MRLARKAGSRQALGRAAGAMLSVLFPAGCRVCEQPLVTASRIPICAECLDSLERLVPPLCQQCGRQFPQAEAPAGAWVCHACRRGLYRFDLARSFARYDRRAERVVTLLKYHAIAPLGAWLAARLEELVRAEPALGEVDFIVPVPLDQARLRQRGYNQAELIARPLAERLGLRLRPRLLRRLRPRPNKLKLSRRERWETVRGAFETEPGNQVDRARILLVDDVLTSGATLDACARALRSAGAAAVHAVTAARVAPAREALAGGARR
ncbi:MAG TPA: double zinc ribbon domain-containing protein [Candidatus Acidoferrales bacterium]|nr:double zinc ribbon domain-containing protein [Candidatus Acidoferrales bacterium]